MAQMNADQPSGGTDFKYGTAAHRLRFWAAQGGHCPLILFVHGGSRRSGTHLDSVGSAKVGHLVTL